MVTKFFEKLEGTGYMGRRFEYQGPNGGVETHIHMPSTGVVRELPAIHRTEMQQVKIGLYDGLEWREVTTEPVFSYGDVRGYRVRVEKIQQLPNSDPFAAESVEGSFDLYFNSLKNGNEVLKNCIGKEQL